MKVAAIAMALAGCAAPPVFHCRVGSETVFRGPAPGAVVTDDGLTFTRAGRPVHVEADHCWRVRP